MLYRVWCEQATINEKVAPELLDYDAPLVASIEAQIEHQVLSSYRLSHLNSFAAMLQWFLS